MNLHVLYEDNHCLAVVKPAGLLTQGVPAGLPTLEALAKAYLKDKYGKAGNVYLGVPHRLDRPVSGVVLFARGTKAARRLAEQFQQRTVRKVYWAVVEGQPPEKGTWADWLVKLPDEARAEAVPDGTPGAKHALMHFRRLAARAEDALLEMEPQTGRMHQIRVQAASRGWPVRGDALYGARLPFGPAAELPRDQIIALHGRELTFLHPIRYEPVTLIAPAPADWAEWVTPGPGTTETAPPAPPQA
jgi:23S rRNA pseudouridine1911/1915/1917 synthase